MDARALIQVKEGVRNRRHTGFVTCSRVEHAMSHYLKSQQRRIDAAFAVAGKTAVAPLKPAARRQGRAAKPRGKPRAS